MQYDTEKLCGTMSERRGYNQTTASGKPFWALDPHPGDVRTYDIAAGLARTCRFNGALRDDIQMYSVAQHCCLVSDNLPDELKFEGLMHDASEAYTGDMIKPLKHAMPDFRKIEHRIDLAVRFAYALPPHQALGVKHADSIAVVTELRDVLHPDTKYNVDWGDDLPEPWPEKIIPWLPLKAREEFMKRFTVLYNGVDK